MVTKATRLARANRMTSRGFRLAFIREVSVGPRRGWRDGGGPGEDWAVWSPSARLAGMDFERAMVVFAHPDDAEFGSAGTVASWTRQGTEVQYVCVTDGSAGSNDPAVIPGELAE